MLARPLRIHVSSRVVSQTRRASIVKPLLLGIIWLYQKVLSPWTGNQCRFYPSCSHYAKQAIEVHGALRGSGLAVKRICKCHPGNPGGFDYVPGTEPHDNAEASQ